MSISSRKVAWLAWVAIAARPMSAWAGAPDGRAAGILEATGVRGGLIVHLGCGNGRLTAALRVNSRGLVQGLDTDPGAVARARQRIRALGFYGKVTADTFDGKRRPYIESSVNLVVAEKPGQRAHRGDDARVGAAWGRIRQER